MITRCFLLTGSWGSGKTIMMASYNPKGIKNPKRLIVDKETRSLGYNAEEHGYDRDIPEALLYSFRLYPDNTGVIGARQFGDLIKNIKDPNWEDKPNMIGIDNIAMLQDDITGWCQNATGTRVVLQALGLEAKHENFLKYRFNQDPYWRNVLKEILREFLLTAKRAGIDLVITTELRNEWENYGVKGYGPDGKPLQRIKGKTAKVWDSVMQIADTCWILTRNNQAVTDSPQVSIDPLNPKMSVVGVPPKFKFTNWDQIWEWESKRGIQNAEDFAKVEMPEIEYREGDPEQDQDDPLEQGKLRLLEELKQHGYETRADIGKAMKKLGISYTLDHHDDIREQLIGRDT